MKRIALALLIVLTIGSCTAYPAYANMHCDSSHGRTHAPARAE